MLGLCINIHVESKCLNIHVESKHSMQAVFLLNLNVEMFMSQQTCITYMCTDVYIVFTYMHSRTRALLLWLLALP